MRQLVLVLCAGLAACGSDDAVEETRPAGHRRMVALLDRVLERTPDDNQWLSDKRARAMRAELAGFDARTPDWERCALHSELGMTELVLGNEEAAVDHLLKARALGTHSGAGRLPGWLSSRENTITFNLGLAYLRLGETANCCALHSPESCILPIAGAGIHTQPEGSRKAIAAFLHEAEKRPRDSVDYFAAVWLLNLAHMTLGTYPDGVPAAHRIPPAVFAADEPFPRFHNVARARGVATFSLSGGAVGDDLDNDGDIDLLVSTWDPAGQMRFFRNRGDGTFEDRTGKAGLTGLRGGLNMVQADYDNDGDIDVLVLRGAWLGRGGRHPNSLLRNDGKARFTDVTLDAGLGAVHYPTQTAAWADYDNDGDVDLYIGNEFTDPEFPAYGQLFKNNGDGTFKDVALQAGVTNDRWAKSVHWGDYDHDRYPDLFVSNLAGLNRLYHNNGDGTFTDVAEAAGVGDPTRSFPSWFWDFDNDGHLDLYVSAYMVEIHHLAAAYLGRKPEVQWPHLYRGDGRGGFTNVAGAARLHRLSTPMSGNFGDLDGDGFLDFYLGTGDPLIEAVMPNVLYRNRGGKSFADVTTAGGFGHLQKGHAIVFADFDDDGDLDIFEQMGGALPVDRYYDALFENPGFGRHWVKVRLVGKRSNRAGIGARIHVVAGGRSIYRDVNSGGTFGASPLLQTIGLGDATGIERIEVFWPVTGKTQTLRNVRVDTLQTIVEGEAE